MHGATARDGGTREMQTDMVRYVGDQIQVKARAQLQGRTQGRSAICEIVPPFSAFRLRYDLLWSLGRGVKEAHSRTARRAS